jgi:hypothetical protein
LNSGFHFELIIVSTQSCQAPIFEAIFEAEWKNGNVVFWHQIELYVVVDKEPGDEDRSSQWLFTGNDLVWQKRLFKPF